jgi:hypothetical protein
MSVRNVIGHTLPIWLTIFLLNITRLPQLKMEGMLQGCASILLPRLMNSVFVMRIPAAVSVDEERVCGAHPFPVAA